MLRSFTTLVLAAALAACGSSSPDSNTTPTAPASSGTPTAGTDPSQHPTEPAEPEPPAEPTAATPETPAPTPPAPTTPATVKPAPATPPVSAKPDPRARLLAAERSAWETAKPVLTKHCATCHTRDGQKVSKRKLEHLDLGPYPPTGHHATTIGTTMRDVLGLGSKRPTMPYGKAGSVKGDELAAIKAWIDAWNAAEKAGAH